MKERREEKTEEDKIGQNREEKRSENVSREEGSIAANRGEEKRGEEGRGGERKTQEVGGEWRTRAESTNMRG